MDMYVLSYFNNINTTFLEMKLDPTREYEKTILITGESGFIGSHMVDHMVKKYPNYMIYGLDALTYAANRDNTKHLEKYSNYEFIKADIANKDYINTLFNDLGITDVIHLAAESHVDNSIENPNVFVETNVIGTVNLLNAFRNCKEEGAASIRINRNAA